MKKKIAVFANGWGSDYLQEIVDGIYQKAKNLNIDLFVFVNYSALNGSDDNSDGEVNIFRLPDLDDFDGIILMSIIFPPYAFQTLQQ